MAGISVLAWTLSSLVTAKTIVLSLPYLSDKSPRKPSRVEQRRIDVAQAVPPMPFAKVVAFEKPALSYAVLAAQLDLAEAGASPIPKHSAERVGRAKSRLKRLAAELVTPSAADVFNRSFGVFPIASN